MLHVAPDERGVLDYAEGLLIGTAATTSAARRGATRSGTGCGYTTWAHESIDCPAALADGADLDFTVTVRDTSGGRVRRSCRRTCPSRPRAAPNRPLRTLAAFTTVRAAPGEAAVARLRIPARAFADYDENLASWVWPAGEFTVQAGSSSRVLALSARSAARARPGANKSHLRLISSRTPRFLAILSLVKPGR